MLQGCISFFLLHVRQAEEDEDLEAAMKRPAAGVMKKPAGLKRPASFLEGADDPNNEQTSRKKAYEFEKLKAAGEVPEYILALTNNAPAVRLVFFCFSRKTNLKLF